MNEPLVLLFNWESQKIEKQQITEGIHGRRTLSTCAGSATVR